MNQWRDASKRVFGRTWEDGAGRASTVVMGVSALCNLMLEISFPLKATTAMSLSGMQLAIQALTALCI